jgi:hypothetical protein
MMAAIPAYGAGWVRMQSTRLRGLAPGVIACAVVAAAASFLSEQYGAPVDVLTTGSEDCR